MTELKLSADVKFELEVLEIVSSFNVQILRAALEDEVPLPAGLDSQSLRTPTDPEKTLANMRAWLKLLDLAITPALIRETLTANIDQDLAEALLRYFVRKKSHSESDRDKTDFLVTYLYRNPRVKGQWESRGYSMDGVAPMPPFEIALLEILEDTDLPELSPEHARTLDEFQYLRDEADGFRDFDALMESEIIQRARDFKNSFGPALYHPHVLAMIAPYNAFFAATFEELFRAATTRIKDFADQVQQKGGSIHAPVHGGVTVKQLTEIQGNEILASEYMHAQEQLRHLSKLKKAVDARSAVQRTAQPAYGAPTVPPPAPVRPPAAKTVPVAAKATPPVPPPVQPPTSSILRPTTFAQPPAPPSAAPVPRAAGLTSDISLPPATLAVKKAEEDNRLSSVQESIKSFVKAADARYRSVVPMGFGNLVLTPAEADAYCADYLQESSFRGDSARLLVRVPAVIARMTSEIEQIERQQNLKYLWRPHAEALAALLSITDDLTKTAESLIKLATQRGLNDKVTAVNSSMQKLKQKSGQATALLAMMNARE